MQGGDRLPATRELAGLIGLNRTTVSAAYAKLEAAGLLEGRVGRGSFVARRTKAEEFSKVDWEALLPPLQSFRLSPVSAAVNFASSRPSQESFPLAEFRQLAKEVVESPEIAEILQLGSSYGYGPLRRYLLTEGAKTGSVRSGDDVLITNGCQQALDLLARVLVTDGTPVLLEDPVYGGLLSVFRRAGANIIPLPVGDAGLFLEGSESLVMQHRPRLLVVTPDFQNPTGSTLSLEQRMDILGLARRANMPIVESSLYHDLRYSGNPLPSLKQLDTVGNIVSIGSYSKIAFPGLRVGWVIGPSPLIARLAEAKQASDLHSDQLSQAILLRFAQSGELGRHIQRTRHLGSSRLRTVLQSCERHFAPLVRFTRPEGGMSLWAELPAPLLAEDLLRIAESRGVSFLAGSYFSVRRGHHRNLRISFGGLPHSEIERGISILGSIVREQLQIHRPAEYAEPMTALV